MFSEQEIKNQIKIVKWGLDIVEDSIAGPRKSEAMDNVIILTETLKTMCEANREAYRKQGLCN